MAYLTCLSRLAARAVIGHVGLGLGLLALAAAPAVATAIVPIGGAATARHTLACQRAQGELIGFETDYHTLIERLDPRSLAATGPQIRQRYGGSTRVISPDGCTMAIDDVRRIDLIDIARFAVIRQIPLHLGKRFRYSTVWVVSWPRRHRLIAYADNDYALAVTPSTLIVVDPIRHRVIRREPMHGGVVDAVAERDGRTVFVLARVHRNRPARLVAVTAGGRMRSVEVARIQAGYVYGYRSPGLAVHGATAFVVGAHAPIARIGLGSMRVSYHRVAGLMRRHTRERPAFVPGSEGVVTNLNRTADWAGHGRMLVTGFEQHPTDHGKKIRDVGREAQLVDVRHWRVAHRFSDVSFLTPDDGRYYGIRDTRREGAAAKLEGFRRDGRTLFVRRLRGNHSWDAFAGRLVVRTLDCSHAVELDPRTGAVIRDLGRPAICPYDVLVVRPGDVSQSEF